MTLRWRRGLVFVAIASICIDIALFVIRPQNSIIFSAVRHYTLLIHAMHARSFYTDDVVRTLKSDECILFAHIYGRNYAYRCLKKDNVFRRLVDMHDVSMRPKVIGTFIREVRDIPWYFRQFGTELDHAFYAFDAQTQKNITDVYDDILVRALYCDFDYTDADYALLKVARDGMGGYIDTHQLIAFILLKRNGCGGNDIDAHIIETANRIIKAQDKPQEFSDLFAERVVVLYWAGHGDHISYAWMQKIIDAQKKDGGWAYKDEEMSNAHTTGLATLALRYYIARKKTQDIFVH